MMDLKEANECCAKMARILEKMTYRYNKLQNMLISRGLWDQFKRELAKGDN